MLLLRKDEGSVKCLNDTLLARLRPYRSASVAATLVTLTGSEAQLPRKEDGLLSLFMMFSFRTKIGSFYCLFFFFLVVCYELKLCIIIISGSQT